MVRSDTTTARQFQESALAKRTAKGLIYNSAVIGRSRTRDHSGRFFVTFDFLSLAGVGEAGFARHLQQARTVGACCRWDERFAGSVPMLRARSVSNASALVILRASCIALLTDDMAPCFPVSL